MPVAAMPRRPHYDGSIVLPGVDVDTSSFPSDQLDDYSGAGQQEGAE
jgi:hypothetical protein